MTENKIANSFFAAGSVFSGVYFYSNPELSEFIREKYVSRISYESTRTREQARSIMFAAGQYLNEDL